MDSIPESVEFGMGSPGDLRFSDVPKPEPFLNTYRDMHKPEHITMLRQLRDGVHRFFRGVFEESFLESAEISMGFHYPVRLQYSCLHMQIRINNGSVCREDGRGIEIQDLIDLLEKDPKIFHRDEVKTKFKVTENIKVSMFAACSQFSDDNDIQNTAEVCRQIDSLSFELSPGSTYQKPPQRGQSNVNHNTISGTIREESSSPKSSPFFKDEKTQLERDDLQNFSRPLNSNRGFGDSSGSLQADMANMGFQPTSNSSGYPNNDINSGTNSVTHTPTPRKLQIHHTHEIGKDTAIQTLRDHIAQTPPSQNARKMNQ